MEKQKIRSFDLFGVTMMLRAAVESGSFYCEGPVGSPLSSGLWRGVNLILGQYDKLGMKTWLVTFSDSGIYIPDSYKDLKTLEVRRENISKIF